MSRNQTRQPKKFAKENYWKGRKNRALHQLSRFENEADLEDFQLPEVRKTRWDLHRIMNNKKEDQKKWHEAVFKLKTNPPHLGLGWQKEELPIPTLERYPTIAYYGDRWTMDPQIKYHYDRDEFDNMVIRMRQVLEIPPPCKEGTYEIYKNGVWTVHLL